MKSALKKLVNWVQLKIYSESTMQKNAQNNFTRKKFRWTKIPEKMNWLHFLILENWEEMAKKRPKKPKIVKNRSFSCIIQRVTDKNWLN